MTSSSARPRFFLPKGIWIFFLVAAVLSVFAHVVDPLGDRATNNVLTIVLALLAFVVTGIWFVFRSGYPRKVRRGATAVAIGLIVLFFALFRLDSFSGEMIPHFTYRFGEPPDRELAAATVAPALTAGPAIDLAARTPWDFPQFLGPRRDLSVDAVRLQRDWESQPPELVWKQPIGAGWSAFAVVNGYAVTMEQRGEQEMVTCYAVETGEMVWSYSVENRYDDLIAGIGPRSTPTIDEGIVYAVTNNGQLLALDGATGGLVWEHDLWSEYGLDADTVKADTPYGRSNSPLIVGPLVIVPAGGTPDRLVSLVAYDKKSGERIWEGGNRQISMSSPAFGTLGGVEQVVIVNENWISGHNVESGEVLWEHPWPGFTAADANVSQAIPLPPDRVFVSKAYGQGAALLRLQPDGDGTFTVEQLWHSARVLRTKFTNVAILGQTVFGLSDGILEAVDLETGERIWKHGRYHQGQILRVDDLLLVLSEDGEVLLVEASAEHRDNVLGRFQAIEGKSWNNIALYGPYLLVRNGQEAACYRLPLSSD